MKTEKTFIRYGTISLLAAFATGLYVPIVSLMLLDKGLNLSSLAFAMGAWSLVVLATEVPSGMISDRYGRKKTYVFAKFLLVVGLIMLLGRPSLFRLASGICFLALARSFASGSFEALCIDQYVALHGKDRLSNISTMLSIWETVGLSVGALLSGAIILLSQFLPAWFSTYDANLLSCALVNLLVLLLAMSWIKDSQASTEETQQVFGVSNAFRTIRKNRMLIALCISTLATGFLLGSVEAYWQPRFLQIAGGSSLLWLVGVLAFIGFSGALLGTLIAGRALHNKPVRVFPWYLVARVLLGSMIAALALMGSVIGYVVVYGALYLTLGLANIAESVLVNRESQPWMRASVLSLSSFSLQVGGMLASGTGGFLLRTEGGSIQLLWLVAATVTFMGIVPLIGSGRRRSS
jgi:MFS transporter, DHA1 family, quinolone resistance protein